ncbi:MAG: hypothetical protein GAK34_01243 [Delftia tsuruhatensis]|nr:MAG: hypothetical protein GAK34_01243 [Delftia tsuruhatensis]
MARPCATPVARSFPGLPQAPNAPACDQAGGAAHGQWPALDRPTMICAVQTDCVHTHACPTLHLHSGRFPQVLHRLGPSHTGCRRACPGASDGPRHRQCPPRGGRDGAGCVFLQLGRDRPGPIARPERGGPGLGPAPHARCPDLALQPRGCLWRRSGRRRLYPRQGREPARQRDQDLCGRRAVLHGTVEPSPAGPAARQRHAVHHGLQEPAAPGQWQQLRLHRLAHAPRHRGRRARGCQDLGGLLRHPHRTGQSAGQKRQPGLEPGPGLCALGRPPRQCGWPAQQPHGAHWLQAGCELVGGGQLPAGGQQGQGPWRRTACRCGAGPPVQHQGQHVQQLRVPRAW